MSDSIEAAAKVIDPLAFQPVGSCNPRGYESYSQEALSRAIAARRAHALRVAERVVAAYRDAKVAELEARCAKDEKALRIAVLALAHANEQSPGLYDDAYNAVSDALAEGGEHG